MIYNKKWPCTQKDCIGKCHRTPPVITYEDEKRVADQNVYEGICDTCQTQFRFTYHVLRERDKNNWLDGGQYAASLERLNRDTQEYELLADKIPICRPNYREEDCWYCGCAVYSSLNRIGLLGTEHFRHTFAIDRHRPSGSYTEVEFAGHRLCVYRDPKYHEHKARVQAGKEKMRADNLRQNYENYLIRMKKRRCEEKIVSFPEFLAQKGLA